MIEFGATMVEARRGTQQNASETSPQEMAFRVDRRRDASRHAADRGELDRCDYFRGPKTRGPLRTAHPETLKNSNNSRALIRGSSLTFVP